MKVSRPKLNVKTGDTVVVISGTNKGKSGKIQKAFPSDNRIIVEGVNMVKRHQKPRGQGQQGGIITKEAPIQVSNVMLMCPSCKKATRVGHKFIEAGGKTKKVRVCKKQGCGAVIDH